MGALLRLTEEAAGLAARTGLPVVDVTEDTTRARPEDLRRRYAAAGDEQSFRTLEEAEIHRICAAFAVTGGDD